MNKFEQVSSGDQQMALAGGGVRAGGPQSDVRVAGPGEACMVRSNASWVMVIWEPPEQTDTSEKFTFPQLGWWAVKTLPASL